MRYSRRVVHGVGFAAILAAVLLQAGCNKKPASAEADADKKPDDVAVQMATVEVHPIETVVTAQGTLTAGQGASARIASPLPGRIMEVRAREGDRVTAGQVVARVDNRSQQALSNSAAAAAAASEMQAREADIAARASATDQTNGVHVAQLALQSARQDQAGAVQQAQTALDAARTDLQKTRAGARPQEIAQADQAVNQAKASRDRAATELDRVKFLFEKGIDAKRQLDDAQTALAVADSTLESARQQADLVRAGARPEDLRAAQIRVQQADQALSQARTSGAAKVAQAQAALRQAQQSALQVAVKRQDAQALHQLANQKRADLAAARLTASFAEVRAPFSGMVTRRALNPGDMADTTTPILEIAASRSLNLLANVMAEDGAKIRPGMLAHIATEAAPDTRFSGRVLSLGQVDPQTNLLAVRIGLVNPPATLKAGTFATANIVVDQNPRAVVVPKQAIVTKEGKQVIFTVGSDNIAHQKEIVPGTEQDGQIEIRKGVSPGEKVIVSGQYELADGAKVHQPEQKSAEAASDPEKAAAK